MMTSLISIICCLFPIDQHQLHVCRLVNKLHAVAKHDLSFSQDFWQSVLCSYLQLSVAIVRGRHKCKLLLRLIDASCVMKLR